MGMPYRKNIITGVVLFLFSIAALAASLNIRELKGFGVPPLSGSFVPRLWAVILGLLSLSLFLRGLRERKAYLKAGKITPFAFNFSEFLDKNREIILTFVTIAVYIALIGYIGFIITTALFLFAQIMILSPVGKRNYLVAGIISVVTPILLGWFFVVFLKMLLPRGILGF